MLSKLREPTHIVTPQMISANKAIICETFDRCRSYMMEKKVSSLAANQVGSNYRMICYVNYKNHTDPSGEIINCINPEIISRMHTVENNEGDPSFPGLVCRVRRSQKIKVRYLQAGESLVEKQLTLRGYVAYDFQRCVDMLDNKIVFDEAISETTWKEGFPKLYQTGQCRRCHYPPRPGMVLISKEPEKWRKCPDCNGTCQSSTKDYYIEGENILFFSGLKINPDDMGGVVVGCKYDVKLKLPESKIITL